MSASCKHKHSSRTALPAATTGFRKTNRNPNFGRINHGCDNHKRMGKLMPKFQKVAAVAKTANAARLRV
jgi:hypothetical protein